MILTPELQNAFNFFRDRTSATALFIRIANKYIYLIEQQDGSAKMGEITLEQLHWAIDTLCPGHHVEIISQINNDGEYDIPDIERLKLEQALDR